MIPHTTTPDWAIACMKRIAKYDDPDLLDAALDLVVGLGGLNLSDEERLDKVNVELRADAARAAADFGYRKTDDCDRRCESYLGLAV